MKPLTHDDLLSLDEFQRQRARLEREVIAAKELRRVQVGPAMSFLFETRLTVLWQIQEMCRVERIARPEAIAHELETYNALLPASDSLCATLLVAYDAEVRDRELRRLVGLHEHVYIELGDCPTLSAVFDEGQFDTGRISAVQFVRFPLTEQQKVALGNLSLPARLVVDHPAYRHAAPIPAPTRGALLDDLAAD